MLTTSWARNDDRHNERLNAELEIPTVEKNVREWITIFIKNNLFRKIKFITSQAAFTRAFRKAGATGGGAKESFGVSVVVQ